jgi:hypothetical protein
MDELPTEATTAEPARRALKAAFRWKPGQSGNPSGLSRVYSRCRRMVRDASPELMAELINLALTAEDERVKSVCLIACLDRAGLRATDYDPAKDDERPAFDASALTAEERAQMRELLAKMRPAKVEVIPPGDENESEPDQG